MLYNGSVRYMKVGSIFLFFILKYVFLLLLQIFTTDNYEVWNGQLIKMSISSSCDDNLNTCLYIKFSGNITCKIILISLLRLSRRALHYCFMFSKVLNTESTLFKFCQCLKGVPLFSPKNFFSGLPNFSLTQ